MRKVSFYLIEKKPLRPADLACRLCQQIYKKHRIWIYCANEEQLQQLNSQLWQTDPVQFIPHGIDQLLAPICLSTQAPNPAFDVCINFSETAVNLTQLPHAALHIIHIIGNNEPAKQIGRNDFRYYRELGYPPEIHKL